MVKVKSKFFCQSCGHESPKWLGKCPSCDAWNTFVEEVISKEDNKLAKVSGSNKVSQVRPLIEVQKEDQQRIVLSDNELNNVLGGGIVPGSLALIGGDPGIGKSTLMLQVAINNPSLKSLYISGEESEHQIRMRAERIGELHPNALILTETNTLNILNQVGEVQPDLLIVDSIQTLHSPYIESSPGSISQIRQCAAELIKFSKETNTPVFLIGHINKEGSIAGPKVLEHMVDIVLQFEGDRNHIYRLLRSMKNRFGSTNELGIYEMLSTGLRQVENPSEILINQHAEDLSGVSIAATMEGMRPMLIEIQALVSSAVYGTPQRSATGYDTRRLNMLLAVLEKRCGFKLGAKDVFLNLAGGLRVDDPAMDLAVMVAVLSSDLDLHISHKVAFAAEVGLSGEIRPVNRIDQRIMEAEKLGFNTIILSQHNKGINQDRYDIKIVAVEKIQEVFRYLFSG